MKKETVKKLLQRLRAAAEKKTIVAAHLRRLEALGMHGVLVELEPLDARELLRRIRPIHAPVPPSSLKGLVPLPQLLATVIRLVDGRILATYRAPMGLEEEVVALLGGDRRFRRILDTRFYSLPVNGCLDPSESEKHFEENIGYVHPGAEPMIDMLAMGVLDLNPLARLRRQDLDPGRLLAARLGVEAAQLGQLLYPAVRRRYMELSMEQMMGRVYYVKPSDMLRARTLIIAPRWAASGLYRVAVETLGAAYVAAGEALALATASAEAEKIRKKALDLGAEAVDMSFAVTLPTPVELYDCRRGRYLLEPPPVEEVLSCLEEEARALSGE